MIELLEKIRCGTKWRLFGTAVCVVTLLICLHIESSSIVKGHGGFISTYRKLLWFPNDNTCTFNAIVHHYKRLGILPSEGKWIEREPSYFKPTLCDLKHSRFPDKKLMRCVRQKNITYIMTLGDSNAAKYFVALNKLFSSASGRQCTILKSETLLNDGFLPDLGYFVNDTNADWIKYISVHDRHCRGCASIKSSCHSSNSDGPWKVDMEQAAMTATVEDSLRIASVHNEAPTTQEFWLKYYLEDNYPDILLIFLPFSHDKQSLRLIQVKADITYFHSLVKTHVPNNTQVVYLPSFSEFEHARNNIMYINRTYNGMLAAERIKKMNNILTDVLHGDFIAENNNIHVFLDLFDMSLSRGKWSTDGIHMQNVWYDSIMSMLMQFICNS